MKFALINGLLIGLLVLCFNECSLVSRSGLKSKFSKASIQINSNSLLVRNFASSKFVSRVKPRKSSKKSELFPKIAGLSLSALIIYQLTESDEHRRRQCLKGIKTHKGPSISALRTSLIYNPEDFNEILIKAIKRNDHLVINFIRKYQWENINFNDTIWKDHELILACYKNGYGDLADFLKSIYDFESEDTLISYVSDYFKLMESEIRTTFSFLETENVTTDENIIKRKELYILFSKYQDFLSKPIVDPTKLYFSEDEIFVDAIKRNDKELVQLMRKYNRFYVDFSNFVWDDEEFIKTCHENGFDGEVNEIRLAQEKGRKKYDIIR